MKDRTKKIIEAELLNELHTHIIKGCDEEDFLRRDMAHKKRLVDLRNELKNFDNHEKLNKCK